MSGFEIVGFLLGLTGPIQQIFDLRKKLKDRYQAYRDNDQQLIILIHLHEKLFQQLRDLTARLNNASLHIPPETTNDLTAKIQDSTTNVQSTLQTLRNQNQKQLSRRKPSKFMNAVSLRDAISDFTKRAKEVEHLILHANSQTAITTLAATGFENVLTQVRQVPAQVTAAVQLQVQQLLANAVQRGVVVAGFTAKLVVTKNAAWVRLDFASTDAAGLPLTTEGKLKNAVLKGSLGKCVDGFRSTRIDLIGKGGVGKSCAVRGLATDTEIRQRFCSSRNELCGGIYSLFLEKDVQMSKVREQIASLVQNTGGWYEAMQIRQEPIFYLCVARAIEWFRNRNCLFLIDVAFDGNTVGEILAEQLSNLSECSYGSAVIFSRRVASTKPMGETIRIDVEQSAKAMSRRNLLLGAGCGESDVRDEVSRDAVDYVLRVCNGLQLAIGIAGTSVHCISNYRKCSIPSSWQEYKSLLKSSIENNAQNVPLDRSAIYSIYSVALHLRQEHATDDVVRVVKPAELPKLYRALCVLESEWAPFEVLRHLWQLQSVKDAIAIGKHFNKGRLGFIEKRRVEGIDLTGFRIHDFVREYAARQAEKHEGIEFWRERRRNCTIEEAGAELLVS